jgi:hypothetical protein
MSVAAGPRHSFGVVLQRDGELRIVEGGALKAVLAGPDAEALLGTGEYVEGFFPAGMVLAVREQQAERITALLAKWRREAN